MSSTVVRQGHQWSSSVVFFQGKSFQQHREAMKKTITDRNQAYRGELDHICLKLTHLPPEKHCYRDTNMNFELKHLTLDVTVDLTCLVSLIRDIHLLSSGKLWCAKKSQKQQKKLFFNPSKVIGEYLLNGCGLSASIGFFHTRFRLNLNHLMGLRMVSGEDIRVNS